MKTLTTEEKAQKKARDNLRILHNRILSAFSLKQITDWHSLYKHLGYDESFLKTVDNKTLTFPELKSFLSKQKDELESKLTASTTSTDTGSVVNSEEVHKNETKTEPSVKETREELQLTPERVGEKKEEDKNYGLEKSAAEKAFLYWFQKKATAEILLKIRAGANGILLLAGTGTGKTFITYATIRRLLDEQYQEGKTWSHIPYLVLTKSTIVEQHKRVASNFFNIHPEGDIEVTNIETLRSKAGQLWVKEEDYIENGEEKTRYIWKKNIQPCVIFLDESQGVKNRKAKQSQIISAYNNFDKNACLVCISATPFTRVIEAKAFAVSTHRPLEHLGFPKGTRLTNETWASYASIIAAPAKPDEYNQAAVERLMKDLDDYVVRVRGVRPQFEAQNGVKIIPFESEQKRKFYETAWERFEKEMEKIKAAEDAGDRTVSYCRLVILLKFAMAAELCHAEHFAKDMYEAVTQRGKAAVAAVKFKQTLIEIVRLLIERYGVSREEISLVWGGGQTKQTKKQKAKQKIKEMSDKLKDLGIEVDEMLADTGLDEVEDRVIIDFPSHYRLGAQDQDERQNEIDKFQRGDSLYCLYTLKAGGVGLSLHHCDELTKFKCRRKESGYAVEEDIPKVPVRSRETFVVVTYNAIELVQGVGRVPRLTSLSPTIQNVYCYANTVEVDMGRIYSQKLRCLSSVVKQKEDWQDIIFGGRQRSKAIEETLAKTEGTVNDESTLIDEGDSEEDDEENGNGKEE